MLPFEANPVVEEHVACQSYPYWMACTFCGNHDPHYIGVDNNLECLVCLYDGEHYWPSPEEMREAIDTPGDTDIETFEAGIRAMIREHREREDKN